MGLKLITDYWEDELGPLDILDWTELDTQRLLSAAAENQVP